MPNITVVGNGFKAFADQKNIWTINDYIATKGQGSSIILGQCLTPDNVQRLEKKAKIISKITPVPKEVTHQYNNRNVLIHNLQHENERQVLAEIYVSGEHDLIADHITGIHISGMILVEAARQLFIVCLTKNGYVDYRFVLNSISSTFLSYIFPVAFTMRLSYNYLKNMKNEKKVVANIQVIQNETICCEIEISSTLLSKKLAELNENFKALEFKKNYNKDEKNNEKI